MTPRATPAIRRYLRALACIFGTTYIIAHVAAATAAAVTVTVKNKAGLPAQDTVVVFDPLDAATVPSRDTAIIDQIDKKFVPKVTVMRTGTSVTFPNSDNIRHQVYSFSPAKTFSLKLYAGSPRVAVIFDKPGLVALGCNIHDSMVAFVAVVDSPYFMKIPPSGTAELNLPPGRYRLRVWNSALSTEVAPRTLSVTDAPLAIPITIDIDPARDAIADWPE